MNISTGLLCLVLSAGVLPAAFATDYYLHPTLGKDTNDGLSVSSPIQSLNKASGLALKPGDRLLLAVGQTVAGSLRAVGWVGTKEKPLWWRASAGQTKPTSNPP